MVIEALFHCRAVDSLLNLTVSNTDFMGLGYRTDRVSVSYTLVYNHIHYIYLS